MFGVWIRSWCHQSSLTLLQGGVAANIEAFSILQYNLIVYGFAKYYEVLSDEHFLSSIMKKAVANIFSASTTNRVVGCRLQGMLLRSTAVFVVATAESSPSENNLPFKRQKTPFSSQTIEKGGSKGQLYLHVGPSGDCWTGASIFAAKHLQPDYVKSVPLEQSFASEKELVDKLLELLEEDTSLAQQIYDTETIPKELFDRAKASAQADQDTT